MESHARGRARAAHRSRRQHLRAAARAETRRVPPILFGSHIDSVPSGGNFDGDLGSLAALGVIEALRRAQASARATRSRWWSGRTKKASRLAAASPAAASSPAGHARRHGRGLERAASAPTGSASIGGDPDRILEAAARRARTTLPRAAHRAGRHPRARRASPIGVVEGIVSIDRYAPSITGFANHAGTTPMAERQDAMLAAAHLTLAVREAVTRRAGPPGRHRRTARDHAERAERHSRARPNDDRAAGSVDGKSSTRCRRTSAPARAQIAATTKTTIAFARSSGNAGAGHARGAARHRARGDRRWALSRPAAERRRPRRADHGAARPDGHDLRAERRRHQPLAEGTDALGRLRERRQRAAAHGPRNGPRLRVAAPSPSRATCTAPGTRLLSTRA